MAGFEADPVPPPLTEPVAAAVAAARKGGCPFASLAAIGLPMPEGHPSARAEVKASGRSWMWRGAQPWGGGVRIGASIAVLGLTMVLRAYRKN